MNTIERARGDMFQHLSLSITHIYSCLVLFRRQVHYMNHAFYGDSQSEAVNTSSRLSSLLLLEQRVSNSMLSDAL